MTTAEHPIPVDRPTGCPLVPLEDRIVCRELPLPDLPAGALWMPERTAGGTTRAEVIAVGLGRITDSGALIPPPAQVGDVVVLAEHGPTEIVVDGETLLSAPPMLVLAREVYPADSRDHEALEGAEIRGPSGWCAKPPPEYDGPRTSDGQAFI